MTHDDSFDDFPSDLDHDHDEHGTNTELSAPFAPDNTEHDNEEWDEHDPIGSPDKPDRKKSSDRLIIGGAVAIGLVVLFLKMSGGHAPQRPPARPANTQIAANTAAPKPLEPTTNSAAPDTPPKPALKLPPTKEDIIYGMPSTSAAKTAAATAGTMASVIETPAAPPQGGFLNDPNALKKVEAMQAAHIPAASTVSTDSIPDTTVKEVASTPPVLAPTIPFAARIVTAPAQPLTPLPTLNNASNGADAATATKLQDIATQLTTIATQLADLQTNSASKSELNDLKSQVAALKEQINQTPATAAQSPAVAVVHRRHAAKPTHKTPAALSESSHWTLKSAQPGIAIVDGGNGRLVTVQAGDRLKGIGTVKSIAQQDGQWVVRGSSGKISQ